MKCRACGKQIRKNPVDMGMEHVPYGEKQQDGKTTIKFKWQHSYLHPRCKKRQDEINRVVSPAIRKVFGRVK